MEDLSKDELIYIAMMLDLPDILSLCKSKKRFNEVICKQDIFWYNKIKQDYPHITDLELYGENYKQIYKNL